MTLSGRQSNRVIWLTPRLSQSLETRFLIRGLAAFLAFVMATSLAAEFLAQSIVAWMGPGRGFVLSFLSASSFL